MASVLVRTTNKRQIPLYCHIVKVLALIAILAFAPSANAAEGNAEVDQDSPSESGKTGEWEFLVAPYLWMSSISMDLESSDVSSSTDVDFSDLLKELDFAMQVHIEARRDKLGLYLDETFIKVSPVAVDRFLFQQSTDLRTNILEFGAGYAVMDKYVGKKQERRLRIEPFVGGRWMWMKPKVKLKAWPRGVNIASEDSIDWFDLVVGTRAVGDFSEKWGYSANLNAGGFGIGSSSEITWNITALLHYRLNERSTLVFGYRHLDIDYEPNSNIDVDMEMSGPLIGVGFKF
jgi:hypothetical protein